MYNRANANKNVEACELKLPSSRFYQQEFNSPVRNSSNAGSRKILIVDETLEARHILASLLKYAGYRVFEASDGEEALTVARSNRPDLIIANILMRRMDGYEFVRQLRDDHRIARTTVIFTTPSFDKREERSLANACGVSHFLPKAASPEAVLRMVRKGLAYQQPPLTIRSEKFNREHLRVVTNKLVQKAAELAKANAQLKNINTEVEQRILEQTAELSRSNADLEQFAFIAAHDLQEPLRKVASYTKLLGSRYKGKLDPDADEFIGYAVDGAERMQHLIRDLLAYSRIGKRIEFVPIDCTEVLAASLMNLRAAIEESHSIVTFGLLPTILGDESQLVQLFQNLIGNALKYRIGDGVKQHLVHISAVIRGNEATFSIRDNGIGIDPKDAEKIFEIFKRLHTRAEYAGNGMGLAICRKIVECFGGRIWVNSRLGHGSTFYFTLPVQTCKFPMHKGRTKNGH